MTFRPELRHILAHMYPDYNDRWNISFDDPGISICRDLHEKGDDCEWEEVSRHDIDRVERDLVAQRRSVHMSHCYQGEYRSSCKYGDDDCPAMVPITEIDPEHEIALLREALALYGDRIRMASSSRPYLQEVIDRALGNG